MCTSSHLSGHSFTTMYRVRHEAAESLGAIADWKTTQMLEEFTKDAEPIVAHSCIVALDMLEFEKAGGFEYADTGVAKCTEEGAPKPAQKKECAC